MDKLFDSLNNDQKQAVIHTEGPLIIFAGAGTGKTRVITYRIAYLLTKGVSPERILAVTFTNKAAEEMRKRVDYLVPGKGRSVWISTFHSFGAHLLRVEANSAGIPSDFLIYDESDQKKVIKDCIEELKLDEKKFKPGRVLELINRAKDDLLDAESYGIHALTSGDYFRQTVAMIYSIYQKKLKQAGALDFGDLIMLSVFLFRDSKNVLEKYQERFQYLLIDEYQDTNHGQYLLTKYLAGKHKNICVVGDDDQSIYSWRGADIRNILEFERDYPSCKMIKLEQNYRSTQCILSAAWQVVKNNQNRVDKKLWTNNIGGPPIKFIEATNETEEAQYVVDEIKKICSKRGYYYSDCAVFYRTNAQSRVFEDAFRRLGIPYNVIGAFRFYERQEVKDILAYLRLIHNKNDDISFIRIINTPRRGIGKTSLNILIEFAQKRGISLWDAINNPEVKKITELDKKGFEIFKDTINDIHSQKDNLTVKDIALLVLEKTGYIEELKSEDTLESHSRIENIQELISAIDEFEKRSPDKSLSGYLTQVSLITDLDTLTLKDNNKVTIMTLHLAKGLEFKAVFITGLEEGLFPIGDAAFSPEDLEEERRLMYVGMTRAKTELYLTWAQERKVFGRSRWNIPSRFLEEVRTSGLVENVSKNDIYISKQDKTDDSLVRKDTTNNKMLEIDEFPLGARVRHKKFGEGRIIDRAGVGDDLKLVVLFDSGEWKKLLVKYAQLEVL